MVKVFLLSLAAVSLLFAAMIPLANGLNRIGAWLERRMPNWDLARSVPHLAFAALVTARELAN